MTANLQSPQAGGGLLPCPFCEAKARKDVRRGVAGTACRSNWHREQVICRSCGASSKMMKRPGAATNAWNRRASTPVRSHEPEFQTAPDNGSPKEVLAYVLECARRWVPEARIIGNARAGDIERALATLSLPAGGVAVSDAMVERLVTMGWNACRKSLYAVCEDVIEEADRVRIKGPVGTFAEEQHCKGYHAGTCYAAKSISRGFNSMEAIDDDNVRKAIREAALSPEAKTGER